MDKTKKYTLIFVIACFIFIGVAGVYQSFYPTTPKAENTEIIKEDKQTITEEVVDDSLELSKEESESSQGKETQKKDDTNKTTDKKVAEQKTTQKTESSAQPENKDSTVDSVKTIRIQIKVKGINQIILNNSADVEEGKTVFEVLKKVTSEKGIELKSSGSSSIAYVRGIGGLNEFDHGPRSGWTYTVNGNYPNKSAGSYILENGDQIEWIYTTNG